MTLLYILVVWFGFALIGGGLWYLFRKREREWQQRIAARRIVRTYQDRDADREVA